MPRLFAILSLSATLAGCGFAGATAPDSHNPAHCIAALSSQVLLWERIGGQTDQINQGVIRIMFEEHRADAKGHPHDETKAEMLSFEKAYADRPELMRSLGSACLASENADPEFAKYRVGALDFIGHRALPVR